MKIFIEAPAMLIRIIIGYPFACVGYVARCAWDAFQAGWEMGRLWP